MGPEELNNLVSEATVLNNAEAINFIASSITASKATRLFTAYGDSSNGDSAQYFSSFGRLREEKEADERFFLKEKNGVENPLKKSWLNALKEVSNEATGSVEKIDLPGEGATTVTLWKDYNDNNNDDLEATAETAAIYELATGTAADTNVEKVAATFNIEFKDEDGLFIELNKDTDFTQAQLRNFLHGSMDEGVLSTTSKAYKGIMHSAKVGGHYIDLTLKQMAALFVSETYLSGSHDLPSPNYINRPKFAFKAATEEGKDNYRFEIVKQSVVTTAAVQGGAAEVRGDRYRIIAVPTGVEGESGEVYARSTILNTGSKLTTAGNDLTDAQLTAYDTLVVTNEFLFGPDTNEVPAYYLASDINQNASATNTSKMFAYQSAKAKQDLNLSFRENLTDVGAQTDSNVVEFSLTQYKKAYDQTSPAKRTLATLSDLSSTIKPVGDSWSTGVTDENDNMELRLKFAIGEANKHKQEISNLQLTDGTPDFVGIHSYTGHIVENTTRKGLVSEPDVERMLITADYSLYTTSLVKVAPAESKMRALANYVMAVDDSGSLVDTTRLQDSSPQQSDLVINAYTSVANQTGAEVYNHGGNSVANIHTVANIFSAGTTVGSGESIRFSDATWGVTQGGKVEYTEESSDNALNKSLILLNSMVNIKTNNNFSSKALLDALKTVIKLEDPSESNLTPLTADAVVEKIANAANVSFDILDTITLTSEQKTRTQVRYAISAAIKSNDDELTIDNIFNNTNDRDLVKPWVVPFAGADLITSNAGLLSKHQTFYSPLVYGKRDTVEELKVNPAANTSSSFVSNNVPDVSIIGSSTSATNVLKYAEIASLLDSTDFSEIVNYIFAWIKGHVKPDDVADNKANMDTIMLMPGFTVAKFVNIPQSGVYKVNETVEVTDSEDVVTTPYSVALVDANVVNYLSSDLTPHTKFLDKATTEKSKSRAIYLKLITMPTAIQDINESIALLIASNADAINEDRLADIILQNVGVSTALADAYDDLLDFANICSAKGFKELEGRIISAVINKINSINESDLQQTTGDNPSLVKSLEEIKVDLMVRYASSSISIGSGASDQFSGSLTVSPQLPLSMDSSGWSSESADQVVYTTTSKTLSALFADLNISPFAAFKHAPNNSSLLHVALMALTKDSNYQGDQDLLRSIVEIDRSFLNIATDFYVSEYSGQGRSRDTEATDTLVFTRSDIALLISEVGSGSGSSGSGSFLSSSTLTI